MTRNGAGPLPADPELFRRQAHELVDWMADYLGEVPWDEFETAKLWYARLKSRRAFRTLLADRVPGTIASAHYADLDF